jgi:hypothetical protein
MATGIQHQKPAAGSLPRISNKSVSYGATISERSRGGAPEPQSLFACAWTITSMVFPTHRIVWPGREPYPS